MGQLKWYKRDPDAALSGMMGLTLEQRGAYNTVLDLIYTRDDNLLDDDRFIAGWCGVDIRVWRRIKQQLIGAGKLRIEAGLIRNFRATSEVDAALSRVASSSDAARTRWDKSKRVSNEIKDLFDAPASKAHMTTTTTTTLRKKDSRPLTRPATAAGQKDGGKIQPKATRIPADWKLSEEAKKFAVDLGLDADSVAGSFLDYWRSVPGARGLKLDWPATWRNWCRRQAERDGGNKPKGLNGSRPQERESWNDRRRREAIEMIRKDGPK